MVGSVTGELESNSCDHIFKAGFKTSSLIALNGSEPQVMSRKVFLKEGSSLSDPYLGNVRYGFVGVELLLELSVKKI